MAPTTRQATRTKHKPGTTNVGDAVLDLVIPYIHDVEDRNSVSLVSRDSYETDGITRKRPIVHVHYYPNPASLSKRFPFIQALTLKGAPSYVPNDSGAPWIQHLALEFKCLKELHMRRLVLHDKDLHTLARTRGKDLRSLKFSRCDGFSTDGLRHISKYCNQLRTFCLRYSYDIDVKDGIWLHQFALNNTVLEKFHVTNRDIIYSEKDLTLLAKNCCNSLISLKIGECYLSKLGDAFRYAVRLEHFGSVYISDEESELVGFQFPPNICSFSTRDLPVTLYSSALPLPNQITKLKLGFLAVDEDQKCLLFKRCPNLKVLYTMDDSGGTVFQVIGKFCKKLRKFTHDALICHVGLMALAKECTKLECLKVGLRDISNEALECLGTHLKNLRKLRMNLVLKDGTIDLPLDNGILAMLMGCQKLESLTILNSDSPGGLLTNVGLEYIGSYGANLRSLSLTLEGNSNTGLVKLSEGCPRLRKLKLRGCPFSKEAVASCVFNLPSLRYVSGYNNHFTALALTRPEF